MFSILFSVFEGVLTTETHSPCLFRSGVEDRAPGYRAPCCGGLPARGHGERASACRYDHVSAGSSSGSPRLYQLWRYQFDCTRVFEIASDTCSCNNWRVFQVHSNGQKPTRLPRCMYARAPSSRRKGWHPSSAKSRRALALAVTF